MKTAVAGIAAGLVVSLTGCGGDETEAEPSKNQVKEIHFECQFGTDGRDLAEPDSYEKCVQHWDSPVQDGSEFSKRAGGLKVDIAKRRCANE